MAIPEHTSGPAAMRCPGLRFSGGLMIYDRGRPLRLKAMKEAGFDPWPGDQVELPDDGIVVSGQLMGRSPDEGRTEMELGISAAPGKHRRGALFFRITFGSWSKNAYVLIPGAVYNGNRFESRRIAYSPKLQDPADIGPYAGPIISDIPRLNNHPGPSQLHIPAGIMALPVAGFYFPELEEGWLVEFDPVSPLGIMGVKLEENRPEGWGSLVIQAPLVRAPFRYRIADTRWPSEDIPADLSGGAEVKISLRLFHLQGTSLQGLFDRFFQIREELTAPICLKPRFPLGEVFRVIEEKYNRENWVEDHGYYSVGMRENFLQDWQIGWTGGMIATLPLMAIGSETSLRHVLKQFDWLLPDGISPSGFFWDSGEKGTRWYGGDIRHAHTRNWHLVRKSGDGLYYILRQFSLMERKGIRIRPEWEKGAHQVADAFERLWKRNGQLGQFVHSLTGEIVVGGSSSGAIVPAALMLAASRFGEDHYRQVASEISEVFYREYVCHGITLGGPGDALQCPDSESGYAMLESFIRLYEGTGKYVWLERAGEMARQFSTWVYGWEFPFPSGSTSGKLGNTARGAVMANVQNVHPAPGICTYSGLALLKLSLYTGDARYARLLEEITRQIPQNLSHQDRPVPGLKEGWISERINTSDWLEGTGEIMEGSTWSEVSAMLTVAEVPSVCLDAARGNLWVFDHLEVSLESPSRSDPPNLLKIRNPTPYVARVRTLIAGRSSVPAKRFLADHANPPSLLNEGFLLDLPPLAIEAGKTIRIPF